MIYSSPLFLAAAAFIWIVFNSPVLGILLILFTIAIFTTGYRTEIDEDDKFIIDYFYLFLIPFNKKKLKFTVLNKVVVTNERRTMTVHTRSRTRVVDYYEYTASLIYNNRLNFILLTKTDKKDLLYKIYDLVDYMNLEVEDQTTGQNFIIDMRYYSK